MVNPLRRAIAAVANWVAATAEGRAGTISPSSIAVKDHWLYDFVGGEATSGVTINRKTSLSHSPIWRGVHLISRDVAKLPVDVMKRTDGGKERDSEHPAHRLLKYRPNEEMSAFKFRETMMAHALIDGNGRAYIDRRGDGRPLALYVLQPDDIITVRVNGVLWYVWKPETEQRRIPATDILDIRGLGLDGLEGYKLTEYGRDSIGLGIAAQQFGSRYFKNDASPRVILEHPARISPEAGARIKKDWNSMYAGLDNSHKTAVLEEGMTAKPFSSDARNAQLIETRKFDKGEVANWLNVPAFMLADDGLTSFASVEVAMQMYLDTGLDPWLVNWEQECREKLLSEREKESDSHVIEFNREAIVRVNFKDKVEGISAAIGGGWMTPDEGRDKLNMNPMPGEVGKSRFLPLNMGLQGPDGAIQVLAPEKDAPSDDERSTAARGALERTIRRMLGRLATQAKRAASSPEKLAEWLDSGLEQERKTLIEMIAPDVAVAAAISRGKVMSADEFTAEVVAKVRGMTNHADEWPDFAPEIAARVLKRE